MDIKSSFYYSINIGSSDISKCKNNKKIFVCDKYNGVKLTPNNFSKKITDLINATGNQKVNYSYLVGWEAAKIMIPLICVDKNYITKILIMMDKDFINGFTYYIDKNNISNEFEIIINEKATLKDNNYDGIISSIYTNLQMLHPCGYHMIPIDKDSMEPAIMFSTFIFKNNTIVDVPFLSELLIVGHNILHPCRANNNFQGFAFNKTKEYSEVYDNLHEELEINKIVNAISDRQAQMKVFEFTTSWFNLNANFVSSANTETIKIEVNPDE